jgi:uncharacterized protein YdhG (YjbR/CyaY superfamily)
MKKSRVVPKTVEEYLAAVPEPARSTLEKVRATIRSVVPPETTEVISYQMPTFRYKGALFAYAAFSDHCSLFPMGSAAIEAFAEELKGTGPPKAPSTSLWISLSPRLC